MTSRALGRNHLAYKGPKPCRNAVLLLNSPTPLITRSTSKQLEKPTRFTEIHDFIGRLPYNIKDHLSEGYTPREPDSDLKGCSQKKNPNHETLRCVGISS